MSPSIVSPLFVLIRSSGAHSSSMKVSRIIHPSAGVSFLSTSFGKYPAPGIGPGHNVVQGLPLVLQVAAINARAVPVLRANDDDLGDDSSFRPCEIRVSERTAMPYQGFAQ